jgi:Ran-binding protein 1
MSDETKPTPAADQTASSEPRLAQDETKLATNPVGDESKEAPNSNATITETVGNAAAGVKDSVFSMFGGGAKKEKKVDDDDDAKDEPSGSSKAKKADDDVRLIIPASSRILTPYRTRVPRRKRLMCTSSPSFV